ncbi:MAG: uracil-DNA glycosylase family protein, partial [Halobacteria archaeon]|nr:uracil-DNA glycosylase family protein [Halobacteria archaeon]
MENVTDRVSNPFGMEPPCGDSEPVHGYGDANADFHFIGDHPGVHGGEETGVPFTRSEPGERLQGVLHETGFASSEYSDEPVLENAYLSYLYMCADDEAPDGSEYAGAERFFDAELRAINAHVLLPVGERAVEHVLNTYTSQAR